MQTRIREADVWDTAEEEVAEAEPQGDPLLAFANLFLTYRRWIAIGALVVAAITVATKLSTPRTYTSSSLFVSETGGMRTPELSGLAAQFGIQLGADRNSFGPQFYIDLLQSSGLLRSAVDHPYTVDGENGARTLTLVDYYETEAESAERRRELAVRELRENMRAELAVKTGVVHLSVKARDPGVAVQINQRLLELLDQFNAETRRSRASAERRFIEERMRLVAADLRRSEDNLADFLRRNRQYDRAPELRFEYQRRNDLVALNKQVFNSLAQSLEQAKVDEIRDTPVLTVVQPPMEPAWPDARGTIRAGVLALLLGALLGLGVGYMRDQMRKRLAEGTEESRQLRYLTRQALYDMRAILTLGIWRRPAG